MQRRQLVVISGLPGSGKTTLGGRSAEKLGLALIDKDEILERLFVERGVGDAEWRRKLSRESDAIFEREARAVCSLDQPGAVLVSHWHVEGMAEDSGTRTEWIAELSDSIVNVQCVCAVEIAAKRFYQRKRHPGHLDRRSFEEVLESLRDTERLGSTKFGAKVQVDTSGEVDLEAVAGEVDRAMARIRGQGSWSG